MPRSDDHSTTESRNARGELTSKTIQGRALDPQGALAVQEKMKSTDLAAAARAKKKPQTVQQKALGVEDKDDKKEKK